MGLFNGRAQQSMPVGAKAVLGGIPGDFVDDGLTLFPDDWFGFDFKWAGRIHDWRYCTRCHTPGTMCVADKKSADREIVRNVSSSLPWRWTWLGNIVGYGVWRGGYGSYNSCGSNCGSNCRHGMTKPDWMTI